MIYDPDYARAFSIIRCTAWSYGYAAMLHGSFTRDLDVVLVPWTEQARLPFDNMMALLAERTGLELKGEEPVKKPHGRLAWSLLFPGFGDPRWIDISCTPRAPAAAAIREAITDSRCEYLYWRDGRCDKCGNVHDGKLPGVALPSA